jgi:putative membrane protein
MEYKNQLEKKLNIYATVVSIAVLALIVMMRKIKLNLGIDFSFLPAIYSMTNLLAAGFLIASLNFIKQKKIAQHKRMNILALSMSLAFLLMYVLYHITTEEVHFCKTGTIRVVYFILLISHIILAAVSFPFILFTFIRGYLMQVERHRKMARWVYWIWLYVAISGPVVYLMLRPCM